MLIANQHNTEEEEPMAQLNITLNREENQELLSENSSAAFKKMLEGAVNSILRAESEEQLSAGRYQRSDERTDYRNGSRDGELNTRIGRITLHVPRHRNVPFRTWRGARIRNLPL